MKKILFVDDEKHILKALRRLFFNSEYNCFYVTSGSDALNILKEYDIDLLVTDIRMPKMDGFELLKIVKNKYPDITRVALSGYSDNDAIIKALETNLVKLYLYKPWENEELREVIKKSFALSEILNSEELFRFINNIENIPTLPKLYNEINKMIEKKLDVDLIASIIERDQSISSKILQVANSAYYGVRTGSLKQAIMRIGLQNVKNIVLSNSVFKNNINGNMEMIWLHANMTNKIVGYIYKKILFKKLPSIYSSAGLLHDIGRIIIMQFFIKENEKIEVLLNNTPIDKKSRLNYEKKLIGIDHQKIGAYLLNWWDLPLPIIEVAMYHHDPLNKLIINKEIVKVTYLANVMSWRLLQPDKSELKLDEEVLETMNIPVDKFYEKIDGFEM